MSLSLKDLHGATFANLQSGRPLIAVVMAATVLACSAVALSLWTRSEPSRVEAPQLIEAPADELSQEAKALAGWVEGGVAKRYDLKLEGIGAAIASLEAIETPNGHPMIVHWQSHVGQPIFRSDIDATEELQLLTALKKHLPESATIFAMPELSFRLRTVFDHHETPLAGVPLNASAELPSGWLNEAIRPFAKRGTADPNDAAVGETWENFRQAMVAEDIYGSARLRTLSASDETYVILHVRDVFDLGSQLGDQLLVGMKDFDGGAHAHDLTRRIKDWRSVNGYASHTVLKTSDKKLRVYFLAEAKDKSTTIAQLLPFDGARVGLMPGTKLVFQTGGYWVYKLKTI